MATHSPARRRVLRVAAALASTAVAGILLPRFAAAQSLDDGLLVPRHTVRATVDYGAERWSRYWEGTRERTNDNIGTVTTQMATITALYGVTSRLTLGATLPYVWTRASLGVLHGQRGLQDVRFAAKLRVLETHVGDRTSLGVLVAGGAGVPTTDYTPDFLPMSIGLGARQATARAAFHLKDRTGFFVDGSAGRAWRSTVHLDRPAYYTDGKLVLSDEVAMPDVADYAVGAGYQDARWCIPVMFMSQRTLGGGDIRRQDMPFVSNRMDFTRIGGKAMYTLPFARDLIVQAGAAHTLSGRNVGRGTTVSGGLTFLLRH